LHDYSNRPGQTKLPKCQSEAGEFMVVADAS